MNLEEIKKMLFEKLPTYMLPSKVIQIEKMPLKPNGKIDDKELKSMLEDENIIDVYQLSKMIIEDKSDYDNYKLDMFMIDSLDTIKLIQILSDNIDYKKSEFSDSLSKSIVSMNVGEIRTFIKKWRNKYAS